jgi:hypothetical protein
MPNYRIQRIAAPVMTVAEYTAAAPVPPYQFDPAYAGADFVTLDELGVVLDTGVNGVTTWTQLAFLRRFTTPERLAIRTAAKESVVLEDFMALLQAATEVRSDDVDVVAGLQALEQFGLIAAGRAAQIMAPE